MPAKATATKKTAQKTADSLDSSATSMEAFWSNGLETAQEQFSKMFGETNGMGEFHKENMDVIVESAKIANDGFEKIASESVAFQKKSFETSVANVNEALAAQSLQDALTLQGQFAKSGLEAYTGHMSKIGQMWTEAARASVQPFSGRVGALFQGLPGVRL